MTQEENWNIRLAEVWEFVKKNQRFPSRHHIEEHTLLNWLKYNRKLVNQNKLDAGRAAKFKELGDYVHQFHTINQYK
ncbi:MAG: helicase associated domain-containing protein [Prevotella sp.]|nr:helicase associated domain-containing protein [Prevotella sp.]